MNIEYRSKEFYRFLWIQKTERSDSTLQNSTICASTQARQAKRRI
jgi:hypothetical protein